MKSHDRKSDRTKRVIAESLQSLLSVKPISKITVAEIVGGCGMTVPTFYNHFSDKYSLVVWIYASEVERLLLRIGAEGCRWSDALRDIMQYFHTNRDLFVNVLSHKGAQNNFMSELDEINIGSLRRIILGKTGGEIPPFLEEQARFYCLGLSRYVYSWLTDADPVQPDEAARICEECLPNGLGYYLY